ncbi:MAG: BadF/BadG/BcrA/BcrD ATPase family protein [Alphaproteobacteria bacterium]
MTGLSIQAFAGIDGGGTRTRARVIDPGGHLIGEGAAGPGSLTLSPEMAADNCRQALAQALAPSGIEIGRCRMVCGVAGHRQNAKRLVFERRLADVGALEVISDGYAALLGAHHGAPGAIVITGTGSVGLSLDENGFSRQIGGFGPVVGDEGGGNWLGRNAVRAALRETDDVAFGEGAISPLSFALIDHMGRDHDAILDWIAAADSTRFAALVPLILQHEAEGDASACRLLDAASNEVCRLIRLIGRQGALPVSLLGGLAETLRTRLPSAVSSMLTPSAGDPMDGALLRAQTKAPPERYE